MKKGKTLGHRIIALLALMAAALTPSPARAEAVTCHLTGQSTGYQVFRLDLQQGGGGMSMELAGGGIDSVVGESYYSTEGILVFNATTGLREAAFLRGIGGQRPRAVISSGNQEIVDQQVPGPLGPPGVGGWLYDGNTGSLNPGSHYVIGFGFGNGTFDVTLNIGALPGTGSCQQVFPSGADLIQYDQTDFTSSGQDLRTSGQAYLVAAGGAGNIALSFPTTKPFFAGYIKGAVLNSSGAVTFGDFVMTYDTPRYDGTIVRSDIVPVTWPPGLSTFKANYRGVLPRINIDGWALDLPAV